jgi:hypothetical protein
LIPLHMMVGSRRGSSEATPFFASDPITTPGWDVISGPQALYLPSVGKTIVAWCFVGLGSRKGVHVAAYDHASGTWSERYTAGNFVLANDDQGHPALARDSDGYLYCFFGSHATPQRWSVSVNPDDISAWTQESVLSGDASYPKIVFVGSTLYLFNRNDNDLSNRKLVVRTATPSAGVASFGAGTTLVDFGANSRVFQTESHVIGSEIHFAVTKSDAADTTRTGVYYFVYRTTTGALANFDGSTVTASGSLPVDLSTADASYRIFAPSGLNDGNIPALQFDSNGVAHVLFPDGTSGSYNLKHMKLSGGAWSSPIIVTAIDDQAAGGSVDTFCLVRGSGSIMQAWYNSAGRDQARRIYNGTSWSGEGVVAPVTSGADFGRAVAVRDAHQSLRVVFGEISGSATDSSAMLLRLFAFGDGGFLPEIDMAEIDPTWANVVLLLGAESRDGSASLIDDSSASMGPASVNGNAQVDTAQFKFGAASLLLDGTGDYITYTHDSALSVASGDKTIEAWIRLGATGRIHTLASKRPLTGATEFAFYVTATNVLQGIAFAAGSAVVNIVGTTALTTGVQYHVALCRAGAVWRLFLNGTQEGASTTESSPVESNTEPFIIGRDQSNTVRDFHGWIDEFRFKSGAGAAIYTANFTAPTAAFPRR